MTGEHPIEMMNPLPADERYMAGRISAYQDGFRAGLEAAAKAIQDSAMNENEAGSIGRIILKEVAKAIRALKP